MKNQERNKIFLAFFTTIFFLVLIWSVHILIEWAGFKSWRSMGNHPHEWSNWWGMLTMPFIHGSWEHLWNNSASFLVLNTMLFYFYTKVSWRVWLVISLFSGLFVWFLGVEGSNHIGASGIVYGLAFFVFWAGIINHKNTILLRVSLLVAFLYGSIVWGIFPIEEKVSWEGHMGGAIAGVFMAFFLRKELPERAKYKWEIEEELEKLQAETSSNKRPNGKTPIVQIYRQFRHRGMDRGF